MFDWFWKLLYNLLIGLTGLVDFILNVFRVLSGMTPIVIEGEETDLLSYFLVSDTVFNAFWLMVFISIGLLFVATAYMMVSVQIKNNDGQKTPAKVIFASFKSLLMFFLIPIFMVVMATSISVIMRQIDLATNPYVAEIVANSDSGDNVTPSIGGQILVAIGEQAWEDGYSDEEKATIRANFILNKEGYDFLKYSDADKYYQIKELNFSVGYLSGILFLLILGMAVLSLAERLVHLVLLFIIAPLPIASATIDDGERFKLWRDQVIVKFLTCYGTILALNVFNLIVPIVQTISFGIPFYGNSSEGMIAFTDAMVRIFLLIGMAFGVQKAPILVGNLIQQGAGSQQAADNAHTMASMGKFAGAAMQGAKALASPLTKPLGAGINHAKSETSKAMSSPFRQASERREKMRQMKSDSKLANKFQKIADKDAGGKKLSSGDKSKLDAYRQSKMFNSPTGVVGNANPEQNAGNENKKNKVQNAVRNNSNNSSEPNEQ